MQIEALKAELKDIIVKELNLLDEQGNPLKPETIADDVPLFNDERGPNLDSVDALTLIPVIGDRYGVDIEDEEQGEKAFRNVAALAAFITENQSE